MKGVYPGQMLTAVGVDPNNQIYPLAYGIVESESKSSCSWFLNCLGDDLDLNERSNFTFISDRQKGIILALEDVFPAAEHRFCLKHIYDNMKSYWRGQMYKDYLWKLATTTTVEQFNRVMEDFKTVDKDAYEYLKKIPPMHWSRSHFSSRPKCDVLLNNMCEVFNRQLVDGREKPIILALEYTREYLMRRLAIVQKDIDKCRGPLTPVATGLFEIIKKEAFKYKATFNGYAKFEVVGPWMDQCVVNMENRTCSCRKWELTGMPCKHVAAYIYDMADNQQKVYLPESYLDPVYWLNTWKKMYEFKIGPVTGKNYWPKSDWPILVKPPKHHVQIGRPKKKRRKSKAELEIVKNGKLSRQGKHVKCGNCQEHGHNKRKCSNRQKIPVGKSKKASQGSKARKTKKARVE
uniref:uncharacterized protein LOC122609365 n=1 Tax=Erigeron canadensis TaxID=72917 RepID=UPI001CB8B3EF|nr:uncharacterized protein LOC122609365 [Erigeron canadensis]